MANILFLGVPHTRPIPKWRFNERESQPDTHYDMYALETLRNSGHKVDYQDTLRKKTELEKISSELQENRYDAVVLANLHWHQAINHAKDDYTLTELLDTLRSSGKPVVVYDSLAWRVQEDLRQRNIPYIHDDRLERYKELPKLLNEAMQENSASKSR